MTIAYISRCPKGKIKIKVKTKRKNIMALAKRNTVKKSASEKAQNSKEDPQVAEEQVEAVAEKPVEVETGEVAEAVAEKPVEVETGEVAEAVAEKPVEVETVAADKEVAVSPATAIAPSSQTGILAELAAEGAEGLKIDWTSFPTIVLDKGEFCTSDGAELDVEEFDVVIVQTRKKYAICSTHEDDDAREVVYCYSMDELDDPASKAAEMVLTWKEEDEVGFDVKEYLDAICIIVNEDLAEEIGEIATLQIPPTSVGKISGHIQGVKLTKKLALGTYITKVKRGGKITKTKHAFYPWAFKFGSVRD